MRTLTIDTLSFSELSQDVQTEVLDRSRYDLVEDGDCYDATIEDFKAILSLMGFTDIETRFSGFYSQGDGASFSASYSYKKGAVKAVEYYAPKSKYKDIAAAISKIQRAYFYGITCEVSFKPSLYCHSNTMSFEWDNTVRSGASCDGYYCALNDSDSGILETLFKDLADELYAALAADYEYMTSDEAVREMLICNDALFTSNGEVI